MRIVILVLLFCGITQESEPRTWTDQSGKFNVRASLAGVKVVLEKEDGSTIEVSLDQLTKADQEYVWKAVSGVEVITGKVVGIGRRWLESAEANDLKRQARQLTDEALRLLEVGQE